MQKKKSFAAQPPNSPLIVLHVTYIYIYIHTYTYTYIHINIYIYIYIYIYTYIHINIYIYIYYIYIYIYIYIVPWRIVHKNCIILHFYTLCYIKEKCGIFIFYSLFLLCFLVRNENVRRPGFYTLQVTRVFSNFPQLR